MIKWVIFICIASLTTLGFFIYFIPKNYAYALKEKKKLTYLIPDILILFNFILWVILFIITIYYLKIQGWTLL